jgi:Xaa-Pro dipeptidase
VLERECEQRVAALQQSVERNGLQAMVVLKPEHVRYFSGFGGYSTRPEYAHQRRLVAMLIPIDQEPVLVVPKVERDWALSMTRLRDVQWHLEWSDPEAFMDGLDALEAAIRSRGLQRARIGLELGFISVRMFSYLRARFGGVEFRDAQELVEELRMIKSPAEIETMRNAGKMAVSELNAELAAIAEGVTEWEIAERGRQAGVEYYRKLLEHSEGASPIVDGLQIITSADRSRLPHALASSRVVRQGDSVMMDFCRFVQYQGYRVGMGRVALLRQPTATERHAFAVAIEAYQTALAMVKPGVRAGDIDVAARRVIQEAGLHKYICHRTGRGVGLEGVELPEIRERNPMPLRAGMVFTLEPSLYMPEFVARVENTLLVTPHGSEVLTDAPIDLNVL